MISQQQKNRLETHLMMLAYHPVSHTLLTERFMAETPLTSEGVAIMKVIDAVEAAMRLYAWTQLSPTMSFAAMVTVCRKLEQREPRAIKTAGQILEMALEKRLNGATSIDLKINKLVG